jgi:hypothetical protein
MKTLLFLILLSLIIISCTSNIYKQYSDPKEVSLIAIVKLQKYECPVRYNFVNGFLTTIDTLFETTGGATRFGIYANHIYYNRYLISDYVDIVDLVSGKFIYRPDRKIGPTRLKEVRGDSVIFFSRETNEFHYFDLAKHKYHRIPKPKKWLLPGTLSPNETMSLSYSYISGEIYLHRIEGDSMKIGSGFSVQVSPLASFIFGKPPFLWLDDSNILTQKSNGYIVIIDINGVVTPIVKINLSKIEGDTIMGGTIDVRLRKNIEGNIIYSITLLGPNKHFCEYNFLIDIKNKSYSMFDPEWTDLGNGFESCRIGDTTEIRYQGSIISKEPEFNRYHTQSINGYLAITGYDKNFNYPISIKVWNSLQRTWSTIEYKSPTWIVHEAIVGWVIGD